MYIYKLFQKYFFNFLFLYMPLAYAMQNEDKSQTSAMLSKALLSLHQENYQEKNWNEILELLKKGVDVNTRVDEYGRTLLMLAADKQENSQIIFNYLLENKANVNAKDALGDTALNFMVKKLNSGQGNIFMCQNLLKYKANPNKKIEIYATSQTPLFIATQKKNIYTSSLIKLLIEYNANFTDNQQFPLGWAKIYDCIPLESAIIHNNTPAIEALCDAGAPLKDIDEYKNTAFHIIADNTKHLGHNDQKENIKAIIKNTYFDYFKPNTWLEKKFNPNKLSKKKSEKFILICYLFRKSNLHKDTQLHIYAYLPEFFLFFSKLRNTLIKSNHEDARTLIQVHFHIKDINQILKIKNSQKQTALDVYKNSRQSQLVTSFLSGENLKKDYKIFRKNFPAIITSSTDNLIVDIYNKYALNSSGSCN